MVLECIIPLARWAERCDPITKLMIQGTARKKALYESGSNWEEILQDFVGRDIEVIRLDKPLGLGTILIGGRCPASDRLTELGHSAESTLLACWHQDHGVIAVAQGSLRDLPEEIRPENWITYQKENSNVFLWAWDKRNFQKNEP